MILHAGLVARRLAGFWRGALIEGDSGCGKSDLALRALVAGFRLVADDRTVVFASGGRLYGRAPETLAGRLEVRGLGVPRVPHLDVAEIVLAVACAASAEVVERHPAPRRRPLLGITLPVLELWPLEPSAPEKLRRALEDLGAIRQRGYQAARSP